MEKTHAKATTSAQAAQGELKNALGDMLDQSQESMTEMRTLLRQMRALTGVAATTIRNSDFLFDEDDPDVAERTL
jgi:signal transduction histidine kinase